MAVHFFPNYILNITIDDDFLKRFSFNLARFDMALIEKGILKEDLKTYLNTILGKQCTVLRILSNENLRFKIYLKINSIGLSTYMLGLYKLDPQLFMDSLTDQINIKICNSLNTKNELDWI